MEDKVYSGGALGLLEERVDQLEEIVDMIVDKLAEEYADRFNG